MFYILYHIWDETKWIEIEKLKIEIKIENWIEIISI